jgi:hypothetical protein
MDDGSADLLRQRFVRGVTLTGAVFTGVFLLEFVGEWVRAGEPGLHAVSWAGVNNTKLVDSLSPIARAYNNILAMLIATVGLAIPLTANMYTPKLIDLFLRDRINRVVLAVMAFGAANVLWVMYIVGPGFAPMWAYRTAVYGVLLGWVVVIPYFFYVVKFLDPSTIVELLMREALKQIDRAAKKHVDPERAQNEIEERLYQIGTIIIKSIDRADRDVTREGIWSLKRIISRYSELKPRMTDAWFKADRRDFVGLSSAARQMITQKRTFLEMNVLTQLYLAFQHALTKAPDAISAIGNVNRVIARAAAARGDEHVVSLCLRFMNSFLREATKHLDTRAVYDVFYQYRELADDISDHHETVREIGGFLLHYARIAEQKGDAFVPQLASFDLAHVIESAYAAGNPRAGELLDDLMGLPHVLSGEPDLLRIKAKLVLAGFLTSRDMKAELERLRENLADVPHAVLEAAAEELVGIEKRAFHEITDRQVNIEWTPPERRAHIARFVAAGG